MSTARDRGYQTCLAAVLALLLPVLFAVGCGGDGRSAPVGGKPDVRGYISDTWGVSADPAPGGNLGSILVEGEAGPGTSVDRASVTIKESTRIYEGFGGGRREIDFGDLEAGQLVEVVFTGPMMESYPVQATAAEITVLENSGIGGARDRLWDEIMSIPGVVGNGISSRQGSPVIVVYLENDSPGLKSKIPLDAEGFKVVTEVTGPIDALPR